METKNADMSGTIEQLQADLRTVRAQVYSVHSSSAIRPTEFPQLTSTDIQCDTWKTTVDDLLARQASELDAAQTFAVRERELREAAMSQVDELVSRLCSVLPPK